MKKITMMMMVVSVMILGACDTTTFQNKGTKEMVGTGAGAVVGGLLGSKVGGGSALGDWCGRTFRCVSWKRGW